MKCTNPKIGELIWQYQFGQLPEEERKRFDAHLLECDDCFQEAYALQPVVERMKENPQPFLKELAKPVTPCVWSLAKTMWLDWVESFAALPKTKQLSLAGAISLAVILLFFLIPKAPTELSGLAQIEPYYFRALSPMGTPGQSEAERLFLKGMEYYSKGEYPPALESLQTAVVLDSTEAEFQFFLGVTFLLQDSAESALKPLRASIALNPIRFEARARWYLGNAYLLLGEGERALAEFQAVVGLGGRYAKHAEEMAGKVEALSKEE